MTRSRPSARHRRLRRRRVHRGGRPPRGARAGVLRPRPRRHRRAGRRAHPRHALDIPMIEFFGGAGRSSRAGTATACRAGTSRCSSTSTCRGACRPRRLRVRDDRPRRGGGGLPQDGAGRGAALRGRAVSASPGTRADRARHRRHLRPRRWRVRGREQHLAGGRRPRGRRRRRPRPPADRRRRRRRKVAAIVCTHGHNDHINAAGALSDVEDAPVLLHPADRMLWDVVYPDRARPGPGRRRGPGGRGRPRGCTRRSLAGGLLPSPAGSATAGHVVLRRHAVLRRAGRDRPQPLDFARSSSRSGAPARAPPETIVHTGHGESTTIGDEAPHLDEWLARGH